MEDGVAPVVVGGGGGAAFEFGVDPNIDPELALALRISMEEERQRQERVTADQKKPGEGTSAPAGDSKPAGGDVVMTDLSEVLRLFNLFYLFISFFFLLFSCSSPCFCS